ncbi:hypothetical protein BN129_3995 [Cronobacter sakazakii 701]|nr:hypothetical protein BN129_3995 [Cronobacter sakazakii 701]
MFFPDHTDSPLRQRQRFFAGGIRQHDRELFSTVTRHQIAGAQRHHLQRIADKPQTGVPGGMAAAVVVALEEIDIEHNQRHRASCSRGVRQHFREGGIKLAAVGKPRQAVGHRHRFKRLVCFEKLVAQLFELLLIANAAPHFAKHHRTEQQKPEQQHKVREQSRQIITQPVHTHFGAIVTGDHHQRQFFRTGKAEYPFDMVKRRHPGAGTAVGANQLAGKQRTAGNIHVNFRFIVGSHAEYRTVGQQQCQHVARAELEIAVKAAEIVKLNGSEHHAREATAEIVNPDRYRDHKLTGRQAFNHAPDMNTGLAVLIMELEIVLMRNIARNAADAG